MVSDNIRSFEDFSREELLDYLKHMARNWLAMDGVWFQAVEEAYGQEAALEMDYQAWKRYSVLETKRIMKWLGLPRGGGIPTLMQVLSVRPQSLVNPYEFVKFDDKHLIYRIKSCRVQAARRQAGLPAHPCKRIGTLEYEKLASQVDPRIKVSCLYCPPDPHPPESFCAWEFILSNEEG